MCALVSSTSMHKGGGYMPRSYRRPSQHPDERSFQIVVGESDLWITVRAEALAGAMSMEEYALARVRELRAQLEAWILLYPDFLTSLVPLPMPRNAPEIVRKMCAAAAVMGVGPMAAVAGAVAAMTAEALVPYSSECLVENGGDSMLHSTRERVVALLPDPDNAAMLGLRITEGDFPVSICASSSTIGHSLSFGKGELAVVRARDAFLADAAATALCNMLRRSDDAGRVAGHAATLGGKGIDGVFLQCQGAIAVWGKMELTAL